MKKFSVIILGLILIASIIPMIFSNSFAQAISPKHQWEIVSDIDELTCNKDLILLQKYDGTPACVSPETYLKLIDRGYGMFDSSIMKNRPTMLNNLIKNMISTPSLMHHWHNMMLENPLMLNHTMSDWISQMKKNPNFLANVMGPMTSDPNLREQMIQQMRGNPNMENTLKQNPKWMESVHHSPSTMNKQMNQTMHQGMTQGMHASCSWCPNHTPHHFNGVRFSNPDKMMDLMHHLWIDPKLSQKMHNFMLENPAHMSNMTEQMMSPVLEHMMNDSQIRQKMMELMLEHPEFMNSIRHQNPDHN